MTKPADRILYGAPGPDGSTSFWRMPTIWAAAEGRPVVEIGVAGLRLLDEVVWFGGPKNVEPTVRRVAEHVRDIVGADLSWPIIMTRDGEILDGAHRVARAYLEGIATLPAVVLDGWPPPDGKVEAP